MSNRVFLSHAKAQRRKEDAKGLGMRIVWGLVVGVGLSGWIAPVFAHNVKTDADVGATFHIDPDHNPRAGESARTWFALTRQGGELIPLEACDCRLTVRSQSGDSSVLNPPLKSVSAEQYRNIPGADIVFPKAGIYELELSGKSKGTVAFQPFKLSYNVTVLPGETTSPEATSVQSAPETETVPVGENRGGWIAIAIASVVVVSSVGVYLVKKFK